MNRERRRVLESNATYFPKGDCARSFLVSDWVNFLRVNLANLIFYQLGTLSFAGVHFCKRLIEEICSKLDASSFYENTDRNLEIGSRKCERNYKTIARYNERTPFFKNATYRDESSGIELWKRGWEGWVAMFESATREAGQFLHLLC